MLREGSNKVGLAESYTCLSRPSIRVSNNINSSNGPRLAGISLGEGAVRIFETLINEIRSMFTSKSLNRTHRLGDFLELAYSLLPLIALYVDSLSPESRHQFANDYCATIVEVIETADTGLSNADKEPLVDLLVAIISTIGESAKDGQNGLIEKTLLTKTQHGIAGALIWESLECQTNSSDLWLMRLLRIETRWAKRISWRILEYWIRYAGSLKLEILREIAGKGCGDQDSEVY